MRPPGARMELMLSWFQRPDLASQVALPLARRSPRAPNLAQCAVCPLPGAVLTGCCYILLGASRVICWR